MTEDAGIRLDIMARLVKQRRAAGLSQHDMARRMGVEQSSVSRAERDHDLRLSTLQAYASALGYRVRIELDGEGDAMAKRHGDFGDMSRYDVQIHYDGAVELWCQDCGAVIETWQQRVVNLAELNRVAAKHETEEE